MAHSKQAKKRILQTARSEAQNRPTKTYTVNRVRDARALALAGDPEANEAVRAAQSALAKAAKAGVIHPNAAARRTSRLAKALKVGAAA